MPPRNAKSLPAPAPVDDKRRTADALWLFDQFLNCDPPMILNVMPVAEKTGMKPNTIVKRINTMQHRYPGFGIITRTSGPKQPLNIAPATPKVSTGSSVTRSTAKTSKRTETVDEEDDTGEVKTRGKKRIAQGVRSKKTTPHQDESQDEAPTDDDDLDEPPVRPASKLSRATKPKKKSTVREPSPLADDNTDDLEEDDIEEDGPKKKKTATPKTRGGRKSAGKGEIEDVRADPEKVVPRGRHAVSRKEEASNGNNPKDGIESSIKDAGTHSARDPANGTKRKRSKTSEPSTSPLTPLPVVRQKLTDMDDIDQSEYDSSGEGQLRDPGTLPPPKKQKTDRGPVGNDDLDIANIAEGDVTSESSETLQTEPVITIGQDGTDSKLERSRSPTAEKFDASPIASAEPEQEFDENMITPANQSIDDVPSPSEGMQDSSGHIVDNDQIMEAPESPTAGRGRSIRPAPAAVKSVAATSILDSETIESPDMRSILTGKIELPLNPVEIQAEDVESTISLDNEAEITTEDTSAQEVAIPSTGPEVSLIADNTNSSVTTNSGQSTGTEHNQDAKSERPEAKRWFSRHPDWLLWSPTVKLSQ